MIKKKKIKVKSLPKNLPKINLHAAGIDIGSKTHFVCIPQECNEVNVKEFSTFTTGLVTTQPPPVCCANEVR